MQYLKLIPDEIAPHMSIYFCVHLFLLNYWEIFSLYHMQLKAEIDKFPPCSVSKWYYCHKDSSSNMATVQSIDCM